MFDVTSQPCGRQVAATIDSEIPSNVRYIYVSVAGTITYILQDDHSTTHTAIAYGVGWHPIRPWKITAVGTMAIGNILLCFTD